MLFGCAKHSVNTGLPRCARNDIEHKKGEREMKKIFILGLLLAPIVAHATDPIGPSAVGQGQTAVIATASGPYAIATAEDGDTTNVVSASYVKGAYNDAIAAVNKVNSKVQVLDNIVKSGELQQTLFVDTPKGSEPVDQDIRTSLDDVSYPNHLVNGQAVIDGLATKQDNLTLLAPNNTTVPILSNVVTGDEMAEAVDNSSIILSDAPVRLVTAEAVIVAANQLAYEAASAKQDNLTVPGANNTTVPILSNVVTDAEVASALENNTVPQNSTTRLLTAEAGYAMAEISAQKHILNKRVSAVTTWGSNTTTKVPLVNQ